MLNSIFQHLFLILSAQGMPAKGKFLHIRTLKHHIHRKLTLCVNYTGHSFETSVIVVILAHKAKAKAKAS